MGHVLAHPYSTTNLLLLGIFRIQLITRKVDICSFIFGKREILAVSLLYLTSLSIAEVVSYFKNLKSTQISNVMYIS
jgi:hypothetical protein